MVASSSLELVSLGGEKFWFSSSVDPREADQRYQKHDRITLQSMAIKTQRMNIKTDPV